MVINIKCKFDEHIDKFDTIHKIYKQLEGLANTRQDNPLYTLCYDEFSDLIRINSLQHIINNNNDEDNYITFYLNNNTLSKGFLNKNIIEDDGITITSFYPNTYGFSIKVSDSIEQKFNKVYDSRVGSFYNKVDDVVSTLKELGFKDVSVQKYNDETYTNATKIWKTRRNDISYFEKEYDCTNYTTLIKQYGQGFVKLNLPKMYYKGLAFISNDYIDLIRQYSQEGHQYHINQTKLQRYGDAHYNNINKIQNTRTQRYKDTGIDIWGTRFKNIEQFEKDYDCTRLRALIKKYGRGWKSLKLPKLYYKQCSFIENKYLSIIENYTAPKTSSKAEEHIVAQILKWNKHIIIIRNNRKLIAPLELDIYLPEHNIAIEYNGIYWHNSVNNKHTPKDYHIKKSLMCRYNNIRLIHIYEFEDIDVQIKLLLELLDGTDNYNKNDFNKNNLIKLVPSPELIYEDESHNILIYGAGKLYE